jgi:hypothetical protein
MNKKDKIEDEPDSWVDWADYLAIEDPDMSRQRIIRILRSLIGEIEQWKDNPTRLYTLLSANKMLNLPHNHSHRQFIRDIIAAAQTKEGLQQIKDYLNSEDKKKEIPDLSPYTHGNNNSVGEVRSQTEIDLAESLGKHKFNDNGNDKDDLLVYNPIKKPEDLLESFNQINKHRRGK